jgi:hypothetical protein
MVSESHSFRHGCRQLLGDFFRAIQHKEAWYISILNPVDGLDHTCLTYLLGFQGDVGVDFLCSTGLVKKGYSMNPDAFVVVKGEWDKFIHEQSIEDIAEPITHTTITKKKHWFINIGRKEKLQQIALDQFNGRKLLVKPLEMVSFQKKFHKQLAELVFMHP